MPRKTGEDERKRVDLVLYEATTDMIHGARSFLEMLKGKIIPLLKYQERLFLRSRSMEDGLFIYTFFRIGLEAF